MSKENPSENKFFSFLQLFIYLFAFIDIYINTIAYKFDNGITRKLDETLFELEFLKNPVYSHLVVFFMVFLIGVFTKSKKNLEYDQTKHFYIPLFIGMFLFVGSFLALALIPEDGTLKIVSYAVPYLFGATSLHVAFSNLSKRIPNKLKEDVWNQEEESFMQNREIIKSPKVFNLPMQFYYKKKVWDGWININPYRGTLVVGVPGSGKSASVIIPYIKDIIAKGQTAVIYDFKYPDLTHIAYYHYLLAQATIPGYKHQFNVINIDSLEQSKRCNPIARRYIRTLADSNETAAAIIQAVMKSPDNGSGSSQFFTVSAASFLSCCIYFLATYEDGQYCTLPHVIAMISQDYEKIFTALFSNIELQAMLAPYASAFKNEAFDQLEGQIGTVRVNLGQLATKESFWIFSGDEINFKVSDREDPSILILANNPDTQSINSAFYAAILLRITKQVNSKGNLPSSIVVDEAPTVYVHKVDHLVATARSNDVAVVFGIQDLAQLEQGYGKQVANVIKGIMGSVLSGAARNNDTLTWLQSLAGKVKQISTGLSIDRDKTSISMNEKMDFLIPAAKISNLNPGEIMAVVSTSNNAETGVYMPNVYKCKVTLDWEQIQHEESQYFDPPDCNYFGSDEERKETLDNNMANIFTEVKDILNHFMQLKLKEEARLKQEQEEREQMSDFVDDEDDY